MKRITEHTESWKIWSFVRFRIVGDAIEKKRRKFASSAIKAGKIHGFHDTIARKDLNCDTIVKRVTTDNMCCIRRAHVFGRRISYTRTLTPRKTHTSRMHTR